MHSYVEGAGEALLNYAKAFVKKDVSKLKYTVNILGATPIDFSVNGQIQSMKTFLETNGFKVISNFALGCDINEMENAGKASVNLVVSSVGIKLAEYFKKQFDTPYVVGLPYGKQMKKDIINALNKFDSIFVSDMSLHFKNQEIYIIGESLTSKSLAKAIYYKYGYTPSVISPVELGNTYHGDIVKDLKVRDNVALEKQDYYMPDEDDIAKTISKAKMVIADPLYKPIVPKKAIFVSNPHEGFSGRLFRKDIINLVEQL